jgi:hypothetical protein
MDIQIVFIFGLNDVLDEIEISGRIAIIRFVFQAAKHYESYVTFMASIVNDLVKLAEGR